MDRYKRFKIKRFNWWFGIFHGYINIRNCFILHWQWLHTQMHPETEFGVTILAFVLPFIDRHRCLIGFNFYTWRNCPKACHISFRILYLPDIEFMVGNGKTWFWIRNKNLYAWKAMRMNRNQIKSKLI